MKAIRWFLAMSLLVSICRLQLVTAQESKQTNAQGSLKEAFKDYFLIGAAINRSMTSGEAFRRSQEQVEQDIGMVKKHYNLVVAENDMKWQLIHPRPGADGYDFAPADAFVDFATRNNMYIAGHTLVWHSQTPNWVFEGSYVADKNSDIADQGSGNRLKIESAPVRPRPPNLQGNNGAANPTNTPPAGGANANAPNPPGGGRRGGFGGGFGGFRGFDLSGPRATREELLARMREHIHTVVGRYKGKVKVWDVVNEALSDGDSPEPLRRSPWSVIIGPDFIAKAFEFAHEADPDAILRYNDYGLENPVKRKKLFALIQYLREQKVPVMAIGSQAHCNVSMTFETMDQTITELASLGLPVHITELDVNTAVRGQRNTQADVASNATSVQGGQVDQADEKLKEAYEGIFRAFLKHKDSIKMVTFWGVNDAVSWRAQGRPLLFDGDNKPKPAFEAVMRIPVK